MLHIYPPKPHLKTFLQAETHYYQPMFTLVGGGLRTLQDASQPEAQVLPQGVHWLCSAVAEIDADSSSVRTADGCRVSYEYLVVATGEEAAGQSNRLLFDWCHTYCRGCIKQGFR
jgi:sulfide:quinone oxidoreductase